MEWLSDDKNESGELSSSTFSTDHFIMQVGIGNSNHTKGEIWMHSLHSPSFIEVGSVPEAVMCVRLRGGTYAYVIDINLTYLCTMHNTCFVVSTLSSRAYHTTLERQMGGLFACSACSDE